jgi:UDP-N-acetylmuramoyl-tripeptide--D-alanyl-D-alanine ligase
LLSLVYWRFFRRFVSKLVDDRIVLPYLFCLARCVVLTRRPLIICVTGSVGKTTTTNHIAAVLSHPQASTAIGQVRSTKENMNNDIGLPLTILLQDEWLSTDPLRKLLSLCALLWRTLGLITVSSYPRLLVLECAAGPYGHVSRSVKLAPPTIGVVTTIGPTHLEHFKSIRGVMVEKSAVVRAVRSSGLVVLGEGHDFVDELERLANAQVIRVTGRGVELSRNIAAVIGRHLGVPEQAIASALAQCAPAKGRLNRVQVGAWTVIDDSYNANPLSMRLGLDVLAETGVRGRRRVAVLGQMAELGDESPRFHEEVGEYAHSRVDLLVGVGGMARHYHPHHWFATSEECADAIAALLQPQDCLLVKGSASVRMRQIVERLHDNDKAAVPAATSKDLEPHT